MKRKFERNTPEEEAAIQAGIAVDPDAPEWTDEEFRNARPASEMMQPDVYKALVERPIRGPQKAPTKQRVSIRLDRDLVQRLRASGPGWQKRLNEVLRKSLG